MTRILQTLNLFMGQSLRVKTLYEDFSKKKVCENRNCLINGETKWPPP